MPLWLVALVVTVIASVAGLKLLRANRNLILFLRRFGYRPATHAVTEATSHLGDFWRVVMLDDDQIEPLAAGGGVESLVDTVSDAKRFYQVAARVVTKVWMIVMWAAATTLAVALVFVLSPGPDLTRADRPAGGPRRPRSGPRWRRGPRGAHRRSGPRSRSGAGRGVVCAGQGLRLAGVDSHSYPLRSAFPQASRTRLAMSSCT